MTTDTDPPTDARDAIAGTWCSMNTAPRDGTVVWLKFGSDGESIGWWDYPTSPVQNDDGTWPNDPDGHPWAFIDSKGDKQPFVNHYRDDVAGRLAPSAWAEYNGTQIAPATPPSPEMEQARVALARILDNWGPHSGTEVAVLKLISEHGQTILKALAARESK